MITKILVPDLGATGGEVRLVEWMVKEGAFVQAGQPLFVLETDKAVQEVEAFTGGYVRKLVVPADSVVDLGAVVALIADSMEESLESGERKESAPAPTVEEASSKAIAAPSPGGGTGLIGRTLVSPAARRLAGERGLDLARVVGSGSAGEIHLRDIRHALGSEAGGRRVPLSARRLAVARRTQHSKSQIPHFYVRVTVDMTDVLALREEWKMHPRSKDTAIPSVNDLLLYAAAQALRQTPDLNARFEETEIVYFDEVSLGIAVGLAEGVMIPVIAQADRFDLWELATVSRQLRERAATGTLSAGEMGGGSLTLSNLGTHGVDSFDAIINPPQAAVLAVGAARPQPAVHQGQLVIRTLMEATLSVDHRIADGVVAAQFLKEFRQMLEAPRQITEANAR